jgi:biopolymer transport protein ExbD
MRLREWREKKQPDLMIIPMIDIMFFLLVFFMISTIYMVEQRSLPVQLPKAAQAASENKPSFVVTMKEDGTLWLEEKQLSFDALAWQAQMESRRNKNFSVLLRADERVSYGKVVAVLDILKRSGVERFALATEKGGSGS